MGQHWVHLALANILSHKSAYSRASLKAVYLKELNVAHTKMWQTDVSRRHGR